MTDTVVEITPRGGEVSCALSGELIIPRVTRRQHRTVEVALVAGRAMLLPGDEVHLRIHVGAGCALHLIDIGGLVVYGRPGAHNPPSHWHARIDLAAGAALTWAGLPTVITDAGELERSLTLRLGVSAWAWLRETLVLGRTTERGGTVRADTDVADAAGPILRETLAVSGATPHPGVLGDDRVMDSILALGDITPPETPHGATRLDLDRGGHILRYLGDAAHESPLETTVAAPRSEPIDAFG